MSWSGDGPRPDAGPTDVAARVAGAGGAGSDVGSQVSGQGRDPADLAAHVRSLIRAVPDFPRPGVLFRDIMPVLANAGVFSAIVSWAAEGYADAAVDHVAGIEARGFLLAAPIAYALGCGLLAIRKPGKLPRPTLTESYQLEYGMDGLQVQPGLVRPGNRVLIVDDVLATGGTLAAATDLLRRAGARLTGAFVLLELPELGGRARIPGNLRALLAG